MSKSVKKTRGTDIGYTGSVTVKVVGSKNKINKQYKLKNKGYMPLFTFISHALLGNKDNVTSLCPLYIVAYNVNTKNEVDFNSAQTSLVTSRPIIKTGIKQKEIVQDGNAFAIAEFTFTLPNTILESSKKINCFALYCSDYYNTFSEIFNKNPSAVVMLDEELEIQSSENVVVVWDLVVGNTAYDAQ